MRIRLGFSRARFVDRQMCGGIRQFSERKVKGQKTMAAERYLSPKQITERLGFEQDWFYEHAREFPGVIRINGRYRVPESGFNAWIASNNELGSDAGDVADRALEGQRRKLSAA